MKIRVFDSVKKLYTKEFLDIKVIKDKIKVLRSIIPKSYLKRTPILIYLVEYLKCDGTLSIIKRNNRSYKGELIFVTTEIQFRAKLKKLLEIQFPKIKICERKDGLLISSLALSTTLAKKFNVPVGKKEEFLCSNAKNNKEREMIIRAIIDAEGNIDNYSGDIIVGNKSMTYLKSFAEVLRKLKIYPTLNLSKTKGYTYAYRLGIIRDSDVIRIKKIGLFNPRKQERLEEIEKSFKVYKQRNQLKNKIKKILEKSPKTIREISEIIKISPFIVRRLLKTMKVEKIGRILIRNHIQILWSVSNLYPNRHLSTGRKRK